MTKSYRNLIGADWKDAASGATFTSVSPADHDEVIGEFPASGPVDVDAAVGAARLAFPSWSAMPAPKRGEILFRVARLLAGAMNLPHLQPEILGKSRSGDIRNCFSDITKARDLLGFEPKHRLEDSLDEFVEWVRGEAVVDRGAEMQRQLQERGLVS